jgi:hypothetical protein
MPEPPCPHRKAAKIEAGEDRLDQDRPSSNTPVLAKPSKPIAGLQPDLLIKINLKLGHSKIQIMTKGWKPGHFTSNRFTVSELCPPAPL